MTTGHILDVKVVGSTFLDELRGHVDALDVKYGRRLELHRGN